MVPWLVVAAHAEPVRVEAVVFPGEERLLRSTTEARLAALHALDPPPRSITRVGAHLSVVVEAEQLPALQASGWVVTGALIPDLAELETLTRVS